jgi:hypothetical protein
MLRATADQITRPDTPHYCMLILAAPTGAVENRAVREFLADLRHDMHTTIKDRLARGCASRAELESVITCAMASWDTLTSAPGPGALD